MKLYSSLNFLRRLHFLKSVLFVLVGIAALTPRADAQLVLDTASEWLAAGMSDAGGPFGEGGFPAWGQSFAPPAGAATLDSFSFWLQMSTNSSDGFDDVDFVAKVYRWNAETLTLSGEPLYVSDPQHLPYTADPSPPFERFTLQLGNIPVNPTESYIFFLSAYEFFNGIPGASTVGLVFPGPDVGGLGYISESSLAELSTQPWYPFSKLAFVAEFAAVPESSTYGLLGAFVLAVISLRRILLRALGKDQFQHLEPLRLER